MAAERVLILYSRVGGGHRSVAQALAGAIQAQTSCSAESILADIYVEHSRFPVSKIPDGYAWILRNRPEVWGAMFSLSNGPTNSLASLALSPFVTPGLQRLFRKVRPTKLVSVLPVVNGLVAAAVSRQVPRPELSVILTDWAGIHRSWVAAGVDQYLATTPAAKTECVRYGATPTDIHVIGYPVRPAFVTPPAADLRDRVLRRLGLDPTLFTILVMVGAEGSSGTLEQALRLTRLSIPAQVIFVCGRYARLQSILERSTDASLHFRVLGFVTDIADLMRSCDLLVTKAGGATLAEAFSSGLPVVINKLVPGQETGNTRYLLAEGAVEYAPGPNQLAEVVTRLYSSRRDRAQLASRGHSVSREHAAQSAASLILRASPSMN